MRSLGIWIWKSVRSAGWAPILVFVVHVVMSQILGAYLAYPALDIPMHFLGGVAIAYFLWQSLLVPEASTILGELSQLGFALLTFTSVCTAVVVWEFAEWSTDRAGLTLAQLGLGDTILDMALGVAGGLALVVVNSARPSSRLEAPAQS